MSGTSNVIAAAIDNEMPDLKAINAIISELTGMSGQWQEFHDYEGYPLLDVVFAVRIFKSLGCEAVIVTNAAGAVNPNLKVGQIIALDDHLALPLYTWSSSSTHVSGPTYETRAEGKFIRSTRADVVRMSTRSNCVKTYRIKSINLITHKPYKSAEEFVENELKNQGLDKSNDEGVEPVWKEETANHGGVLEIGNLKSKDRLKIVKYVDQMKNQDPYQNLITRVALYILQSDEIKIKGSVASNSKESSPEDLNVILIPSAKVLPEFTIDEHTQEVALGLRGTIDTTVPIQTLP
ncbi:uncharacterized protein MELLADRAFT_105246 [Melampsora larici-populina 98AG31]|uniref:purine-nucleoside phosphorylase n=1 Tax=Melampsora larici-populina (strain 98AG31 / pathotype 3-4-7) TaxID=747676 RepID=F4RHB9_MELLP|nr:uncharacterized protein MELLADRAFT_105246 [Melampsora larici-populina 98AG31]EGG08277.1 hypothetical protein MELLADRAFT_105246 [Melampsora larici-populina 98AG31]